MNKFGQTICLSMIVKNEAPVIVRCLESVKPFIDHWIIVDTGSTDGTQAIIENCLSQLPGSLHQQEWQDFAFNRSQALLLSKHKANFSLIIDADDLLIVPDQFEWPELELDSYSFFIQDHGLRYPRIQLVNNNLDWRYRGVLHEFIDSHQAASRGTLPVMIQRNHDGARRRDPNTYVRDADILQKALLEEQDPFLQRRYTFYLAQSYRDAQRDELALKFYLQRAEMGGWEEEVYYSLYQAGKIKERLGFRDQEIIETFMKASQAVPFRNEARYAASRFCRIKRLHAQGYEIAKHGLAYAHPQTSLFGEPWISETGLLDEFSVNAHWIGRYDECLDACLKILSKWSSAEPDYARVLNNAQAAARLLQKRQWARSLGRAENNTPETQHKLDLPLNLHDETALVAKVLVSIVVTLQEDVLLPHLNSIDALSYPKKLIVLRISVLNSSEVSTELLHNWAQIMRPYYADIIIDLKNGVEAASDERQTSANGKTISATMKTYNQTLISPSVHGCEFLLHLDLGCFVRPSTLSNLVSLNLPIIAPLLRTVNPSNPYANFYAEVTNEGDFEDCDQYQWILNQWIKGIFMVPSVDTAYLIRSDALEKMSVIDETKPEPHLSLCHAARLKDIQIYIDNRELYGYFIQHKSDQTIDSQSLKKAYELIKADTISRHLIS